MGAHVFQNQQGTHIRLTILPLEMQVQTMVGPLEVKRLLENRPDALATAFDVLGAPTPLKAGFELRS